MPFRRTDSGRADVLLTSWWKDGADLENTVTIRPFFPKRTPLQVGPIYNSGQGYMYCQIVLIYTCWARCDLLDDFVV